MKIRLKRVNQLIKQELGKIILEEVEFPLETLVTISRVETSADLREAKVWLSVLPFAKNKEVFRLLRRNVYHLQKSLNRKLVMRPVPKIIFLLDRTEEKAEELEELLDRVREE